MTSNLDVGTREVLGVAIDIVYRFSNTFGEKFVTRRTERDADGLLAGSPASPQFKLNSSLRDEHFESTDGVAAGFTRLPQKSRVGWIVNQIVSTGNAV